MFEFQGRLFMRDKIFKCNILIECRLRFSKISFYYFLLSGFDKVILNDAR